MGDFLYMSAKDEDAVLVGWNRRQQQLAQARTIATPEMAAQAVALLQARPNASRGVVQATAAQGVPLEQATALVDMQPPEEDWFDRLADGTANVAAWPFRQFYQQVLKPVVRGAFLVADTAAQEIVQRPATALMAGALDGPGGQTIADAYRQYGSSTGVQAVQDLASGRSSFSDKDDPTTEGVDESFLGTGFFAGGTAAQRSYDERTLTIDGQRANFGRALPTTRLVGEIGNLSQRSGSATVRSAGRFLTPGEAAYNTVAGISQFAADVLADPLALVTGGSATAGRVASKVGASDQAVNAITKGAIGLAQDARKLDPTEAAAALREAAGAVDGAKTVLVEKAQGMLRKPEILRELAEADHLTILEGWSKSTANHIDADMVKALGDATTEEEVAEIILKSIANPAGITKQGFYKTPGVFQKKVAGSSLTGNAPTGPIHVDDLGGSVDTINSWLKVAKVGRDERAAIVNKAFAARSQSELLRVAEEAVTLPEFAKESASLRNLMKNAVDEFSELGRHYGIDHTTGEMIVTPWQKTRMQNGIETAVPTPQLASEMLRSSFQMPDVLAVRRAAERATRLEKVYATAGWEMGAKAGRFLTDDLFKPAAILRPAYVVRIGLEEQARLAMSGMDSLLTHPLRFIMANVVGARATDDAGAVRNFLDKLVGIDEAGAAFDVKSLSGENWTGAANAHRVLTRDAWGMTTKTGKTSSGAPNFTVVSRFDDAFDETKFLHGWNGEFQQAAGDAGMRHLAQNGGDLDDFVNWVRTDPKGQAWARFMSTGGDEFADAITNDDTLREAGARAIQRLHTLTGGVVDDIVGGTGGNQELIESIARGVVPSKKKLAGMMDTAPNHVKVDKTVFASAQERGMMDRAVEYLFDNITGKPTSYLARWPAFRQSMVKNIGDAMPSLADDALRAKVYDDAVKNLKLTRAEKETLGRSVRMASGKHGIMEDMAEFNDILVHRSADEVKALLFDTSKKSNAQQALGPIFPFLDAWKEVTETWTRLAAQNPAGILKGMQGYQSLEEGGTVYTNDFGEKVFAYPGGRALSSMFANEADQTGSQVGIDFEGRVQGANIVAQGVGPGFGPLVQWTVGSFDFFDNEGFRQWKEFMAPFGTQIDSAGELVEPGNLAEALTPAWARKMQNAITGGRVDEVQWNSTVGDTMKALTTTGRYDPQSPEGKEELLAAAERGAFWALMVRGIVQGVGITGPSASWKVNTERGEKPSTDWNPEEDPDGKWHSLSVLAGEYWEMLEASDYDSSMANQLFVDQYGVEPYYIAQSKTNTLASLPATAEGAGWVRNHSEFAEKYPQTVGYFVPPDEDSEFDYSVYRSQIDQGQRQSLTARQQVELANKSKAYQLYNAAKDMLKDVPNSSKYSGIIRAALDEQYPGWQADVLGVAGKASSDEKIKELRVAVNDPDASDSPAVVPLRAYFAVLSQIESVAQSRGAGLSAARNADLRDILLRVGTEISMAPGSGDAFAPVWSSLLKRQLED